MKTLMNQILITVLFFSVLSGCSSAKKAEKVVEEGKEGAKDLKEKIDGAVGEAEKKVSVESSYEYIKSVKTKVRAQSPDIKTCYTKALRKSSDLLGVLYFKWDILKDGTSENFRTNKEKSTIANEYLELCIMRVLARIEFEPLENKKVMRINYPFKFTGKKKTN